MDVSIVRDTIPIETVYGEMLEDGIAKVQITTFSENTSQELVTKLNVLSSFNPPSYTAYQWGLSGDIPVTQEPSLSPAPRRNSSASLWGW